MGKDLRPTQFKRIIEVLAHAKVEFVLIGGIAAIVHGSARATFDVDVVYARNAENIRCLAGALKPFHPYLRGAPPGLPFQWDEETISKGLNFTLTTDLGSLDLLGEVVGGGRYEDLQRYSNLGEAFGVRCICLGLERLIHIKRAAGRPKDFEAIAELEAIREEKKAMEEDPRWGKLPED